MDDLETARDLRVAADYLRAHGWLQGEYGYPDGPRCAEGALLSATGCPMQLLGTFQPFEDMQDELRRYSAALKALGFSSGELREIRERAPVLHIWNDDPDRTALEVIDRLESAALNLEIRALAASGEKGVPISFGEWKERQKT